MPIVILFGTVYYITLPTSATLGLSFFIGWKHPQGGPIACVNVTDKNKRKLAKLVLNI